MIALDNCCERTRFRGVETILAEEVPVGFETRTIEIQIWDELDFGQVGRHAPGLNEVRGLDKAGNRFQKGLVFRGEEVGERESFEADRSKGRD